MESNNELKEIYIKKSDSYYFDDIININDLDLDRVLLDEKSYENILIYDVAYKCLYGAKLLRIILDKVDAYLLENMIRNIYRADNNDAWKSVRFMEVIRFMETPPENEYFAEV